MKAFTLHQPWASLAAVGVKKMETRSWAPPIADVNQRIAIHAAKRPAKIDELPQGVSWPWARDLPLGEIVATAMLRDALQVKLILNVTGHARCTNIEGKDYVVTPDVYGDFTPGRWVWLLDDVMQVKPGIPCRGFQGLWGLPEEIEEQLKAEEAAHNEAVNEWFTQYRI